MGNSVSTVTPSAATAGIDSYVSELGDIHYDKSLGSARFMKTIRGRQRDGTVVVKIFVKPESGYSLKRIARKLNEERDILSDVPNAIAFQKVLETDRAGYLIRQYFFSSLYDRISTRPFMNLIEKKWVTYQLLKGLADSHARNVYHGDIKTENCLMTSWNWVYLSDFAGYKPTFLPEDNPADFSFFFDTSSRRTCYLAPERFYKPGVDTEKQKLAEDPDNIFTGLTTAMDIFSIGCVIAELFSEGTPIFSLSQMFKYRSGEFDPTPYINKIEDDHIKALIRHMIQLDPSKRYSADQYLAEWRDRAFPKYFYTFLHQYIHSVTESAGESSNSGAIESAIFPNIQEPQTRRPKTDADEKIERIHHDFDKIMFFLGLNPPRSPEASSSDAEGSVDALSKGLITLAVADKQAISKEDSQHTPNEGALIFLSLLCSSMRNTAYPSSRMNALDMLLSIGRHVADDIKLDRLVPYIVSCLSDDVARVKAHAVKTLAKMLDEVETLDVINVTIFPEYILPALQSFPLDKEVLVRSAYAGCIAQFAQTAMRYLELAQLLKNDGAFAGNEGDGDAEGSPYEATYDSALFDLQATIEDQIRILLVDPDSSVKRALLSDMTSLCIFLGKQRVDDVLLSHMITYLNGRDWMLRSAFFESIVGVGTFVGGRSLEEYILPLMVQALTDSEEFVVEKVLKSLASLCDLGLFQKMAIWDLVGVVAPLLCHPNLWIRYGAIGFIASTSQRLPVADIWCMIYPIIRPFMRSDVGEVNELHLRENVKPPLSRNVFESSIQWAAVANRTSFWPVRDRPAATRSISVSSSHSLTVPLDLQSGRANEPTPLFVVVKSSEDEKYLDKLRSIGMTQDDEYKLTAMREYIWKLSRSRQNARPKGRDDEPPGVTKDGSVDLQQIGITPVTVFLSPDLIEKDFGSTRAYPRMNKAKAYDSSLLHPHRKIVKSSTTGNMPRISSESIIFSATRTKDSSTTSIYEGTPYDPSALGSTAANLYLQSASDRQSTASFASSIAPSSFQASSFGQNIAHSLPNSPETARVRSLTSNIVLDKNAKRTRILLTPGSTVTSETGKAAAATSMSETNAQGTIELPANERTVQDVIAGSGVDMPKPNSPPWQAQFDDSYSGLHGLDGRGPDAFGMAAFNHSVDGGKRNLAELLVHQTLKVFQSPTHEFGPTVLPLSEQRRLNRNNSQTVRSQWRPKGILVAHLAEHKAAVNQICVSPDHNFFVSCSDDGSVKIWDTARLEKNVTNRARMSYNSIGGKVTCMSFIENTHSVAAASDNGSIHVFRVHYISSGKYGKCETVRKITLNNEYAVTMEHYHTESQSLLVYATNRGNIYALELGTMRPAWQLSNNISHGVITAMVIDRRKSWLLVGTNRGVLTLWDLRFMISIRSWVHPTKSRISRLVIQPPPQLNGEKPIDYKDRIIVASGKNEVSVWDIEQNECLEIFGVRNADDKKALSFDSFKAIEPLSGSELLRNSFTSNDSNVSSDQSVHAVIFPTDCDYMITAGADRKIRYWEKSRIELSFVISGHDPQDQLPKYAKQRIEGLPVHYEVTPVPPAKPRPTGRNNAITAQQQQLLRNHLDAIMDIALTELPCMLLISGDRDGVIKVFS
ncbi:ARM repeat-containing protein [Linnemannia elongata AG-77]|uniref:non-specific serine/threonine protein kinase n=1 Tax=Linnemannia elongata AG-77 TaxID=1314771 RepID=A0A197K0W1_9FUNG|nr:ARM repeat-containing protein [Linnemannia elongata AG-77]